jgi:hypothetical protein
MQFAHAGHGRKKAPADQIRQGRSTVANSVYGLSSDKYPA